MYKRLARTVPVILVLCVVVWLVGCSSAPPEKLEPYKIGGVFALSGAAATSGTPVRDAAQLAVDYVNEVWGGINGHPLQLIAEDDQTDPSVGITKLKKLVLEDKVSALFNCGHSAVGTAIAPLIDNFGVPTLYGYATMEIVPNMKKWGFRDWHAAPGQGYMQAAAAEQLGKEYGVTKWGVLVENTPYGSAIADVFRERLQAKPGLQIVGEVGFEYSALEMTSEAAKLVAKGPEAIAVLSTGAPGGLAAKSVRMAGFKGPLLVVEPVVTKIAQMGPLLEGTMGATVFLPGKTLEQISQPRPAMKVVYEYWNKRGLGAPKGWWEPLGFEQVIILANAMKAVGPDRAKIQAYLDNNFVYEGVFGQVRFTPKQHEGLYIESFVILELKNGVLVEHIPR